MLFLSGMWIWKKKIYEGDGRKISLRKNWASVSKVA